MDDFNSLEEKIKSALLSTIRSANSLGDEDIAFHRSLDASVGNALDRQNARLLGLADRLVGTATANTEIVRPPRLSDLDAVEGNWKAVVDVVDSLLERADTALDEFTGAVKRLSPGVEQAAPQRPPKRSKIESSLKSQDIEKPQLKFEHVPKNDEVIPFKPLLLSKPHASVPLETAPIASDSDTQLAYPHPYQLELEQYRYPSSMYTHTEPIMYRPFESTTATLVDTEEALGEMLEELKQAKEIAIDLEHHDSRTYIGIVSLMQISTRDKDWIVDTLKPWRRKLQCLNEVFADPSIIKVLHGAYMDVMWLQRDLGLYLVGLFDTHHASRALGYKGGSLAFLLKKFINFDAQKQYQMADWRVRPLPQELFDYARSDTHFLLYIFDCMRNELIERSQFKDPNHEGDKIWDVLQKSTETALQRYEHPMYDAELGQGSIGWYRLLQRTPAPMDRQQFAVFRAIHKWRDDVAREQDDSIHYIMPNHAIFSIAKAMPPNRLALFGVAQPTQTVRLRADELVSVIAQAKEAGEDGPTSTEMLDRIEVPQGYPTSSAKEPATVPQPTEAPALTVRKSAPIMNSISSILPLRSTTSAFWGPAFDNSAHQKRTASSKSDVSLAVPLPPLTAEIFADPVEAMANEARSPTPEPAPAEQVEQEADDTFVLKDFHRKRKRTDPFDSMAANSDEVTIDGAASVETKLRQKAEKKAAKKAAKQAKAAAAGEDTEMANGVEDEAPFDYASAPSILNPPRETKESMKERKKKEKQLNPYAKSLDAPKGLPRNQKEKAGKSMTFKK